MPSSLRSRLALIMAILAATTALVVGVVSYRLTEKRFSDEIRISLDRFADELQQRNGIAVRTCTYGELPPPPGAEIEEENRLEGRTPGNRSRRRSGPRNRGEPNGLIAQCLNRSGAISLASRVVLPVDNADRSLATQMAAARRSRNVRTDDREFRLLTVGLPEGGAVQIARELTENNQILASLIRSIAALVTLASVLAALAGMFVASRIAKPIGELTNVAEAIAGSGQLDVALPVSNSSSETGRLAKAFASMVDALRTSRAQQTQLVHDASHELRTPLTSIRANISLLKRHPELSDDQQSRIVADLSDELSELTDLVNELVGLAAEEASAESTGPVETYDAGEVISDVVTRWQRRTGRTITLSAPTGPNLITGRPKALSRALSNLVSNAVKFSPGDTTVGVTVTAETAPASGKPTLTITVDDEGSGFSDFDRDHAFDRFYRSELHRSLPGSGLGLSIVAKMMADEGGTARAGKNERGGARVTLQLNLPVSG
jgi:two-component system, OmpR family, sensor histidine kinase MprB